MEKKVDKIQNLILVTKENFRKCFIDFKNVLKSEVLEYIIFNNEISTSNEKYIEKFGIPYNKKNYQILINLRYNDEIIQKMLDEGNKVYDNILDAYADI